MRYATGGDRYCADHDASDSGDAMARLAELTAAPGDRADDGADTSRGT